MNPNLDQVDNVTLDLMVNQPQYERYLRAREADLSGKYDRAKRFYKKRIMEMTRDLLKGETLSDIFVLQAFDAYAKSCIIYFRNKDKNDTLQEEYIAECNAVGHLPPIVETETESMNLDTENDEDGEGDGDDTGSGPMTDLTDSSKRKLEILLSFDKHKTHTPTLDTYVIKTSTSSPVAASVIPKKKEINLDDPKFKTKDIKPKKPTKPNSDE